MDTGAVLTTNPMMPESGDAFMDMGENIFLIL